MKGNPMLTQILAYAFVGMSALGFVLTVLDRILAKTAKKARIPEIVLFCLACLLGGLGVMLGLFLAPRGIYKKEFRLGIPALAAGEIILLAWMVPDFLAAVGGLFK